MKKTHSHKNTPEVRRWMMALFGLFCGIHGSLVGSENPAFLDKLSDPENYSIYLLPVNEESICGSQNDLQSVETYDGRYSSLGFDVRFVQLNSPSTGALRRSTFTYCSGTLIAADLFLTASHCVDTQVTAGDIVVFNYQNDPQGSPRPIHAFPITEVVEDGAGSGFDYAILRLGADGNGVLPGEIFGFRPLTTGTPSAALIIQHPGGGPKKVDGGTGIAVNGHRLTYSDIDTLGGTSGSGVLNSNGEIAAVHAWGGCSSWGGSNSGVRIHSIQNFTMVQFALYGWGGNVFKNAQPFPDSYLHSWYGWVYVDGSSDIFYKFDSGWQYIDRDQDENNVWIYDFTTLDWRYTKASHYPWIYSSASDTWFIDADEGVPPGF